LYRAPVATFHNWVNAFRHPINPLVWGAVPVAEFFSRSHSDAESHSDSVDFEDSPFERLTQSQASAVLSASNLYEILGVPADASPNELRSAYRARARDVHPDLNSDYGNRYEEMTRVNQAWELLSDPELRTAYDWLEHQKKLAA
jgi:hypothetical protein